MSENSAPIRPFPTLLLICAFGLWAGAATMLYMKLDPEKSSIGIFFSTFLAFALLLCICAFRSKSNTMRLLIMLLLGFCAGIIIGQAGVYTAFIKQNAIETSRSYGNYTFEIIEDEQKGSYGSSCLAQTKLLNGEEVKVQLNFKSESATLRFGHLIYAKTSIELPRKSALPYMWSKGVIATADIYSYENHERSDFFGLLITFRDNALARLGSDSDSGTALLRALLFGERAELDEDGFYQDIRSVGLAHLVAVSGAHLVIVSGSLNILLSMLKVPRRGIIVFQVVFLLLYLILTGMPVSALRAACMSLVSFLSFFPGRRSSALNALGICIMVMVVFNPWSAISISFLLSSLSTLGIIMLVGLFSHWSQHFFSFLPKSFHESISLTLSASVLVSPLTVALFSQYSIVSPAMNVIAAPCFMVLCVGGLSIVILAVFFPSLGGFLLEILREVSEVFCAFVKFVAGLPYIAVPAYCDFIFALCLSFALLLFIWGVWPKPTGLKLGFLGAGGLAVVACIVIILPSTYSDEVIMLDVGQGDAFLVRSQGSVVLIDTGNDDAALLRAMGRHRVYRLDAVIISHADDDHCGSLSSLRSFLQIDNVCFAEGVLECECSSCVSLAGAAKNLVGEKGIKVLSVEDHLRVGAFEVEVIWPDAFSEKGGNADSLSFLMTKDRSASREDSETRGQTMLFCGDAEAEELMAMVEKNRLGIVDIYKVGHHGSKNALTEKLVGILSPRLALVSVGENNRYGHPADETLSLLENVGSSILRTDKEGDVVCKFEDERLVVSALG